MEKRFGKPAADAARKIGHELHQHLVRGFIHDLSGVLTPVKANAAMLVKQSAGGVVDAAWLQESAERIVERIEFCERLFDNMKAYARRTPLERNPERLSEIVRDARRIVADRIMTYDLSVRSVRLTVDVPEHIVLSVARPWIAVAVANVLHNAFDAYMVGQGKFTEGEILLRAVVEDTQVAITVRDRGRGIDKNALTELRRFIPGTTSKTDRGTGYGLPLVHRYVDVHGGSLTIDSEQRRGTTVTITLPLKQP